MADVTSKYKQNNKNAMKQLKIWSMMFLAMMMISFISSCSKDDDKSSEDYYVKYDLTLISRHINDKRSVTVKTEKGSETINLPNSNQSSSWEGTYGPVKKGFVASISCRSSSLKEAHVRISVAKGSEPFAVKSNGSTSAKFTINY